MRSEFGRVSHEVAEMKGAIKSNADKVKTHKVRPYLVANILELLDLKEEDESEESAMKDVSLEVSLINYRQ